MFTTTIPTEIAREDFLAAIKPLLDLCGVGAEEVYPTLLITSAGIEFTMGAPLVADVDFPEAIHPQGHQVGQCAEWTLPITIKLVD